ncbi:MAG: 2-oxo-4-hydroxy-4-carboxy-5-ureidoimidazoline decarboxylase [Kordiimonadaceae bacterium]|nr:2-oxo-4-hydroxy-4-carboxy-5-ureidoimidazoline decarboxylase [Kordiimonadaceae bacterium]
MSDALFTTKPSMQKSDAFLEIYGGIYEHSLWIAAGAYAAQKGSNLDTVNGLHSAMMTTLNAADEPAKMTLICAHPDLAGKLAVGEALTAESTSEQQGAGLDRCTPEEFEEFQTLNTTYKTTFGFPFIIAVKGLGRQRILAAFRARINNDRETEFNMALEQINRIAYFRLIDLAG